ncbi:MAG TPA: hypothetical protein VFU62_09760 [Hanamia sp.]|nr:hypothetical protein [Hanamia sp.]
MKAFKTNFLISIILFPILKATFLNQEYICDIKMTNTPIIIMVAGKNKKSIITWIKRIGFWGFLFFLLKGLVWLVIGYFLVK